MRTAPRPTLTLRPSPAAAPGLAIPFLPLAAALLLLLFRPHPLQADERAFTFSYEADVLPKGAREFEQWITLRAGKAAGAFTQWDLREELELGLTERLTTALYLNGRRTDSRHLPGNDSDHSFSFKGLSSEWKYQVLNPNIKPLGLLLYGETTFEEEAIALEEKLVLQKNFGSRWISVLNLTLEQEWEFEEGQTELEGVLEVSAAVAWKFTPRWWLGWEALHRRVFADWKHEESSAYFTGPAIHYGGRSWWLTLSVLPQVRGFPETKWGLALAEEERIQVRMIAGVNF